MCPIKSVQYSNIDNSQRPQVNKLSEFLSGKSGSIESHKVSTLRAIACSIYEEYLSQSGSFHIRFSNVRIRASNRSIKGHGMKPAKRHRDLSLMNKWYISSNMHYLMRNFFRQGWFSNWIFKQNVSTIFIFSLFDALQNKCFNLLNCDATLFPGFRNSKFYIGTCFSLTLWSFKGLIPTGITWIKICWITWI